MGRRGYPPEFRRRVLDLIESGRTIADVARDLGVSEQTIYTWRRQDRIDRGLEPGTSSSEHAAREFGVLDPDGNLITLFQLAGS